MSLIDKLKTDLASFNYKKVEKSRKEPSNVRNLPTPPTRVNEVTTTNISSNFSKLANMDRGSNDVKQPSDFYLNMHRFNDGFGNIGLQVIKTTEDLKRWAKWTITPKGILFNIKQAILQRFNANSLSVLSISGFKSIALIIYLIPLSRSPICSNIFPRLENASG